VWAFLWTFLLVAVRVARLQGWSEPIQKTERLVNTIIGVTVAVLLGLLIAEAASDCADHVSY